MLQKPKFEKQYTFVKIHNQLVEDWLYFTAYQDGSGGIDPSSEKEFRELEHRMEITAMILMDGSWKNDWEKLEKDGWVEVNEAKRKGLIHFDWVAD